MASAEAGDATNFESALRLNSRRTARSGGAGGKRASSSSQSPIAGAALEPDLSPEVELVVTPHAILPLSVFVIDHEAHCLHRQPVIRSEGPAIEIVVEIVQADDRADPPSRLSLQIHIPSDRLVRLVCGLVHLVAADVLRADEELWIIELHVHPVSIENDPEVVGRVQRVVT